MRDILLGLLLILLILKYTLDWGMEIVESTGDLVMKPVNRSIKCLSLATGVKVDDHEEAA